MNKTLLYLLYFCAYSTVLLLIGKSSLRDGNTVGQFFLGGRHLSLWRCMATFSGTWVSAASILSLTGSVYESGYNVVLYSVFPWFIGAFFLVGISDRLYDNEILTNAELFYKRFGSKGLQVAYAAVFIAVYIFYLVIQIKGFGVVASTLFDIPYGISILLVYLFILYTTFGGYRSVTRSDVFNLILLAISIAVLFVTITSRAGGVLEIHRSAAGISGFAHPGTPYPTEPGGLLRPFGEGLFTPLMNLSMFCGWGLGLAANPQYTIRMLSAQNKKTARRTVLCSLGFLALVYFSLIQIGLGMRVLIPTLSTVSKTDEIITWLINNQLYSAWSGFFLFSIIGACVSTANSQLLLIASSFAYDIAPAVSRRNLSRESILRLSRLGIFAGGTLSMLLAIDPPDSVISYGGDIWGVVAATLFPAMYGTLLFKKVNRTGVWASLLSGLASILLFYPLYYAGLLRFHPSMPCVAISTAALAAGSLYARGKGAGDEIPAEHRA